MSEKPSEHTVSAWRRWAGATIAAVVVLLALVETATALLAPLRAPAAEDWAAAAAEVRQGFRPGDLIIAAPDWADPVMRLHLGDLVPVKVAGRLDDARFGRVWEIGQRGARAALAGEAEVARETRHGGLTVRRLDRRPAQVTYDFVDRWAEARVSRTDGAGALECPRAADRHQCPDLAWSFVKPDVLEIGHQLKRTLYLQPVAGAHVVIEFPQVPMGRELAVGGGLHHVWFRKNGQGTVVLRVLVDGQPVLEQVSGNRTGFAVARVDTAAYAGRTLPVRFELHSAQPFSRHYGFAAEARNP